MDEKWRGFIAGFLFWVAGRSLIVDAIGKEDYLTAVPHLWVEWYISGPVAVLFLLISFTVMSPVRKGEDE